MPWGDPYDYGLPPQSRAEITARHRAKRRRVEVMLTPGTAEAVELARLTQVHGSAAGAIKALLAASAAAFKPHDRAWYGDHTTMTGEWP